MAGSDHTGDYLARALHEHGWDGEDVIRKLEDKIVKSCLGSVDNEIPYSDAALPLGLVCVSLRLSHICGQLGRLVEGVGRLADGMDYDRDPTVSLRCTSGDFDHPIVRMKKSRIDITSSGFTDQRCRICQMQMEVVR